MPGLLTADYDNAGARCRRAGLAELAYATYSPNIRSTQPTRPYSGNVHINAEMDSQNPFALLLVASPRLLASCDWVCSARSISAARRVTS
jgi:hypothetical protein